MNTRTLGFLEFNGEQVKKDQNHMRCFGGPGQKFMHSDRFSRGLKVRETAC